MKSIVIADSRDTCLGFELAGIKGIYAKDSLSIESAFKKAFHDPGIGIIFLTEGVFNLIEETVNTCKNKQLFPLVTMIPDRHGYQSSGQKGMISRYIRESVGIASKSE